MTERRRVPLAAVREARDRHQVPFGVIRPSGPLTEEEFEELQARFREEKRSLPVVVTEYLVVEVAPRRRRFMGRPR
ncbi:MAG TPA: hypothetical protein VI248_01775 [Kineosporiaceae bacterium]